MTDAAGAQRELVKDALGRLTDVYEDPAGSNFHTQYVADALNNVRQVMQGGSRSSRSGASTAWITSALTGFSGTAYLPHSNQYKIQNCAE